MAEHTGRSKSWRIIPFLLIALIMLISGGAAIAGVPAAVPAGIPAPPQQSKGGPATSPAQPPPVQQGNPTNAQPAITLPGDLPAQQPAAVHDSSGKGAPPAQKPAPPVSVKP